MQQDFVKKNTWQNPNYLFWNWRDRQSEWWRQAFDLSGVLTGISCAG
jgi:hypothetical protein